MQSCLASGTTVGPCECVDTDTKNSTDVGDTNGTSGQDVGDTNGTSGQDGDTNGTNGQDGDTNGTSGQDGDDTSEQDADVGPVDSDASDNGDCPIARITIQEGTEVLPQTLLHLSGNNSTGMESDIVAWEWSVIQPAGSVSRFLPSAFEATPTFEANVVGIYTFRLKVTDAQGNVSCVQAESVVTAATGDGIRVELLWRTPGDANESDTGGSATWSAGSDVDLHFLHPNANGRYFDWSYDCYWENTNPEWGLAGTTNNPRLDRDDADGGGPENLNLATPEQNVRYRLGVHYWNDWGYGESFATIRIYIHGVLREQWTDVRIVEGDLWESHDIDWPSGVVTRITTNGEPRIISNYPVNP